MNENPGKLIINTKNTLKFIDYLNNNRIKMLDGSMGTMLEKNGGYGGWEDCLHNPEKVIKIHKQYIGSGAEMVITNTATMNRLYLEKNKRSIDIKEANRVAVRLAKEAAGGKELFILGNLSSIGQLIEPNGDITEKETTDNFIEQCGYLAEAGVDGFIIETMFDIKEALCTIKACHMVADIPVVAMMSFETIKNGGRTLMGNSAVECAEKLHKAGVSVMGSNCGSLNPLEMSEIVRIYKRYTDCLIAVEPNAGKPQLINGKTCYKMSPGEFAEGIAKCIEEGATLVGGCCGTTPEHIRSMYNYIKK